MIGNMKKEKPIFVGFRLYKKHRKLLRATAKYHKISDAAVIRNLIEDIEL